MAKWLKLYATYTFTTSPNLCHRTTKNKNAQFFWDMVYNEIASGCLKIPLFTNPVYKLMTQQKQPPESQVEMCAKPGYFSRRQWCDSSPESECDIRCPASLVLCCCHPSQWRASARCERLPSSVLSLKTSGHNNASSFNASSESVTHTHTPF